MSKNAAITASAKAMPSTIEGTADRHSVAGQLSA